MKSSFFLGVACWLLSASFGPAQPDEDGIRLTWKGFDPKFNDVYFTETRTVTRQNMKVMGQDIAQTQEQTFVFRAVPGGKDRWGAWLVQQEIIGVRLKIDIGGNVIEFDSAKQQPAQPLADVFSKLLGVKVQFVIDRNMRVKNVTGTEEFIKKLRGAAGGPVMDKFMETLVSPEAFTQMVEPMWGAFPTIAVRKGTTWTRESETHLGNVGRYQTKTTYKYEGGMNQGDRISFQSTMKFVPADKKEQEGLPFRILQANLTGTEGEGEAIFDRERGRFSSSKARIRLAGQMTIEIGGMETVIDLKQEQETFNRTLDANPLGK